MLRTRPSTDVFSAAYDLLARVYLGGPRAAQRAELPALDAFLEALETVDASWSERLEVLLARTENDVNHAQRTYLDCLVLPVSGRYVPPFASVYLDGESLWGPTTFWVLEQYQAEGLAWNRERRGPDDARITAPDHVGIEMAFLSVVSSPSVRARKGNARLNRVHSFLVHGANWLPKFAASLASVDQAETLQEWTTWTTEVLRADLRRRTGGSELPAEN